MFRFQSTKNIVAVYDNTKIIEEVVISEEERQLELKSWLEARRTPFNCEGCMAAFQEQGPYLQHLNMHLSTEGDFECDVCRLRFKMAEVRDVHRRQHYRRFRCSICDVRLRDDAASGRHVATHHPADVYRCHICDKNLGKILCLKQHIEQCHSQEKDGQVCPVCHKVFQDKTKYSRHVRDHNRAPKTGLSCGVCRRKSPNVRSFRRHALTHAAPCPLCDIRCATPQDMALHLLQHNTGD